jgi:hypothetical protein
VPLDRGRREPRQVGQWDLLIGRTD